MNGSFRFLRVQAGKCYFAQIDLEVLQGGDGEPVADALPTTPNVDAGEVNARSAPTWVEAARDGVHDAIERAQALGLWPAGMRVRLVKLVGSFVDTRDDVVRCAAALAVWQAIGSPEPGFDAAFDGGAWTLLGSADARTPVPGTSS